MKLFGVEPEDVDQVWDVAEPLLRPAVARTNGCYATDDVLAAIKAAAQQLWIVTDSDRLACAIVTEVVRYPRKTVLWVPFVGGHDVLAATPWVMDCLEGWGARHGCVAVQGAGRRGWMRSAGFRDAGAMLWKDTDHGRQ